METFIVDLLDKKEQLTKYYRMMRYYNFCPDWLRDMIINDLKGLHKNIDKVIEYLQKETGN